MRRLGTDFCKYVPLVDGTLASATSVIPVSEKPPTSDASMEVGLRESVAAVSWWSSCSMLSKVSTEEDIRNAFMFLDRRVGGGESHAVRMEHGYRER